MNILITLVLLVSSTIWARSSKVESEVERVNTLRESLVTGVQPPVSIHKFKGVCGPVGVTAKNIAKENGWVFRQASHKYRNPKNKANKIELQAIARFQKEPETLSFWKKTKNGSYYFRRIIIKKECLVCHGSKETRPAFVEKKYPSDKAYGFEINDLRGIYSVFLSK